MSVILRHRNTKKGPVYYLDITHLGYRRKETLSIPFSIEEKERLKMATIIASDREREILLGQYDLNKPKSRNFVRYFENYVANFHPGTRKYISTSRHLKKVFGSTWLTTQLNESGFLKFRRYLEDNFNGETPATMWSCFKTVVNHAIKEGIIKSCPDVPGPKRKRLVVKEILYASEIQSLYESTWPDDTVCRAFLFCCFTGLTRKEVVNLMWKQISLKERKLTYYRAKNYEQVVVDLSAMALKLLPDRITDFVFPHLPSDSYCSRLLKSWSTSVGIEKNVSWYCARHTFAVLLLTNGTDLKTVSRLMGHTSTKHTEKYLNFIDPLKRQAVDRLPDF